MMGIHRREAGAGRKSLSMKLAQFMIMIQRNAVNEKDGYTYKMRMDNKRKVIKTNKNYNKNVMTYVIYFNFSQKICMNK